MYTVYDREPGDSPAKITVYKPYESMYVWFWPTLHRGQGTRGAGEPSDAAGAGGQGCRQRGAYD